MIPPPVILRLTWSPAGVIVTSVSAYAGEHGGVAGARDSAVSGQHVVSQVLDTTRSAAVDPEVDEPVLRQWMGRGQGHDEVRRLVERHRHRNAQVVAACRTFHPARR